MTLTPRPFRDESDHARVHDLLDRLLDACGPPATISVGDFDWWRATCNHTHEIFDLHFWEDERTTEYHSSRLYESLGFELVDCHRVWTKTLS